jgi:hypothetical protein
MSSDFTGTDIGTQPAPTLDQFSQALRDTASPASDDSGSLADHEAAHAPGASQPADTDEDAPAAASDRGDNGQFKPRHRAASQRADADDVPFIAEHTKRIKDAEARLGADIVRKDGESERVYTLRRRAELLERQSTAPTPQQAAPTPTAPPQPARRQSNAPPMQAFPAYDAFIAIPGLENATYEDYVDARADWRYSIQRHNEREQEATETAQRTERERTAKYAAALPATRQKYADFDTVVRPDLMVNATIVQAIMASEHGPEIAYLLAKDHDLRNGLNADTAEFAVAAVAPMRRYLDSLVAGQRPSTPSTRTAAGPTGAALALAPPPAPRPPTPVRTGTMASADEPPGDDSSLSAHMKAFGPKSARR